MLVPVYCLFANTGEKYNFVQQTKNMKKLLKTLAVLICVLFSPLRAQSDNVRIINASDGLTSQSVFKLCQVSNGFILACTYTGMNLLNGFSCEPFGIGLSPFMTAGSMIDDIQNGANSDIWVHTNMGLEKFDLSNGTFEYHPEISGTFRLAANENGVVVVMKDDGKIYLYNKENAKFEWTGIKTARYNNVFGFFVDDNNILHIAFNNHHVFGKIYQDSKNHFTLKSLITQIIIMNICYYPKRFSFFSVPT